MIQLSEKMIQLSENWRLTADEVQFILQKKNIRKQSDGGAEEVWVNKYYYPTLQILLSYLADGIAGVHDKADQSQGEKL